MRVPPRRPQCLADHGIGNRARAHGDAVQTRSKSWRSWARAAGLAAVLRRPVWGLLELPWARVAGGCSDGGRKPDIAIPGLHGKADDGAAARGYAEDAEAVAQVKGTSVNQLIVDSSPRRSTGCDLTRTSPSAPGGSSIGTRAARASGQATRYLDLAEFLWLAEQVTGIEATTLAKASRIDLSDSALHAPAAGFGDKDFYPKEWLAGWLRDRIRF